MKVLKRLSGVRETVIIFGIALMLMSYASADPLLIAVEIDSSQYSIGDYGVFHAGNELRIDYLVKNISSFTDPSNAFKTIEISAGVSNTVYDALVPQGWTADIYEDRTVFSTDDHLNYIYPEEIDAISFSLLYESIEMTTGQGLAMTPIGLWTENVPVNVAVPEPSTIILFGLGVLAVKRKKT